MPISLPQMLGYTLVGLLGLTASAVSADSLRIRLFSDAGETSRSAIVQQLSNPAAGFAQDYSASPGEVYSGINISRGNAMLRSLLVPGWGESYLGYHGTARAFFWVDVAIWATVIGLETYSNWREDQFLAYAADHADAQMTGKEDGFYADIGNYMTTEEYNQAKLLNRDFEAVYTDPAYYWSWDSDQNRRDYDHFRIQSRSAHNKVFFVIGAAALNRLISVIDTGKKANDLLKVKNSPRLNLKFQPDLQDQQASLSLVLTASLER